MGALLRSAIWLGAVVVLANLRKPAGGTVFSVRHDMIGWLGGGVLLAGLAFHFWSNVTLARAESGARKAPGWIMIEGPYRYVRHPIYLAAVPLLLGTLLLYAPWRWANVAEVFVVMVILHVLVIGSEEPALRRRFGADYDDYCRRVPRWFPRLH
jgi:protein-S-isoprenylcysteine O-methyltransferase Ste14